MCALLDQLLLAALGMGRNGNPQFQHCCETCMFRSDTVASSAGNDANGGASWCSWNGPNDELAEDVSAAEHTQMGPFTDAAGGARWGCANQATFSTVVQP